MLCIVQVFIGYGRMCLNCSSYDLVMEHQCLVLKQQLLPVCTWQVVVNRDTNETLLCIAYVFEVSTSEHGAQHHIYRLVRD